MNNHTNSVRPTFDGALSAACAVFLALTATTALTQESPPPSAAETAQSSAEDAPRSRDPGAARSGNRETAQSGAVDTLQPRDLDGDKSTVEAYYDTQLDITWLANASLAANETFGVEGVNAENGRMHWEVAVRYMDAMNAANYLGVGNWRLPSDTPLDPEAYPDYNLRFAGDGSTDGGYAFEEGWGKASELGHMYYATLGNLQVCDVNPEDGRCRIRRTVEQEPAAEGEGANNRARAPIPEGLGFVNGGPFRNIDPGYYWAGQKDPRTEEENEEGEIEPVNRARGFNFSRGFRLAMGAETEQRVWPVVDGSVGEPIE